MNIVLVAHDNRKELMTEFCIAYKSILQSCDLYATGTTGAYIAEASGLIINKFAAGEMGGMQMVKARVALNEIDMVIHFRDPMTRETDYDEYLIFRQCDMHNIPFATNLATAEMLVKGYERGDLDWRELVRPLKDEGPVTPIKKVRTRRSRSSIDKKRIQQQLLQQQQQQRQEHETEQDSGPEPESETGPGLEYRNQPED